MLRAAIPLEATASVALERQRGTRKGHCLPRSLNRPDWGDAAGHVLLPRSFLRKCFAFHTTAGLHRWRWVVIQNAFGPGVPIELPAFPVGARGHDAGH